LLTIIKTKGYFSINLMFENYINVWGIYCQQGLSEFLSESSMRLAFFSISASSIVILATYSASFISNLVLCTPKLPFSTLEGYVKDGSYKLIVVRNSAEYDVPTHVKDPVFLQMYELLEEKYLPLSTTKGFEKLCERNKLALYAAEVYEELNIIPCKVVYIETGRIVNLAITLTKENPYTGLMNYHLRRFQLNGVINKLKNKFLIRDNPNKVSLIYGLVELSDVTPALTMLAGCM
ncbi:uncharacterized protein LOC112458416, partial [Temnothorax curvispinosus]|uniref:Uncharacterized protein LOC112458416 n=1 Tax=Temnothorax curvispinosus TaxID=300111 RepID=A0A6J1Q8X5_9HYME